MVSCLNVSSKRPSLFQNFELNGLDEWDGLHGMDEMRWIGWMEEYNTIAVEWLIYWLVSLFTSRYSGRKWPQHITRKSNILGSVFYRNTRYR